MATKSFKIGIIGYGLSAKTFHIPFINYLPDFTLYAIVQRSPKPGDDASKDWPDAKIYRSVEELVRDDEVDVVVVGTAPVMHFEMAKMALENGKHGRLFGAEGVIKQLMRCSGG
jgi:predicted dehydrogenase